MVSNMKQRAFTLIELMVVASIIILVAAVAIPAIGPMMASNQMSEAVGTLNGLLTTAQTAAVAKGTPVGIRIERAFEIGPHGHMRKPGGVPIWLDHQQARIVDFAGGRDTQVAFTHDPNSKVHVLPKRAWLAPGYGLVASLAEGDLIHDPHDIDEVAVNYNRFETFYIVFNKDGELIRFPWDYIYYADRTQRYPKDIDGDGDLDSVSPRVDHPDNSARSVLVYERKKWDGINPNDPGSQGQPGGARYDFLRQEARVLNINRATGSITGSSQP